MALPITPAQQAMCREVIAKWLAMAPGDRDAILRAQWEREAKFRDAIGFPWHKATPHDT
jgi:hypothetical protein